MSEKDLGLHIKSLTDKIKASVDALLKEHDLTFSQTMIIGFLSEQGGRATQKEIEEYLQVAHPTVVGIISRLEKNNYVDCFNDERDRRNKIVCTTEKALNIVDDLRDGRSKLEKRLTRGLSKAELAEFRRILDILIENI